MTHDEQLVPARAGRDFDSTLADLTQARPYAKYPRYGSSPSETNLKDYLFVVLKRKWLILSLILIITSLATIQAYRDPSIYEGVTTIRIEGRPQSILSTGNLVISGQPDPNFWGTQLKLLQNPALARQVIVTLDLQHNPKFLSGQAQTSIVASIKRIFSRDKPPAVPAPNTQAVEPVGEEEMRARQFTTEELVALEPYEDAIAAGETIDPVERTSLVTIHFRHTDPELAQKIANTLADIFVQNNVERITAGASKAEIDLTNQVAKVQAKIKEEEKARFAFAKDHNLPIDATPGTNLEQMRLQTYSAQLLAAEDALRTQDSIYEAAKNAADPMTAPEVQSDQRIQKIREKISELEDKRNSLLELYTAEWPAVKQIDAQLAPLKAQLAQAPKEVFAGLKSRRDSAAAKQRSLVAAYARQHGVTIQQTKDQIDMAIITQALETDKQYLNTLTQRLRELTATSGSGTASEVTISNYSRLPHEPVGPARMRTIVLAFVMALLVGIGLAFLLDFLDDTLKSVDDVDRYLHLPALALIPAARSEKAAKLTPGEAPAPAATTALAMVNDVRSPIAESYRHLRTSLLLSSAGTQPRTILVTSSQPSEGKTTTAINTAFMLAQTGAEVLIIDCDLRRPRLHSHFNLPNGRGLTNCLSGDGKDLDELLHVYDKQPNLKLLTSGPIPPNPAELLGSDEMRKLLTSLSERFTHIIVDSPPAISFTDASILSTFVDGVILVVHGGRSSRAVVRRAKQKLMDVGAHIFGVVLNNVKIETKSDYYYAGYYGGYYDAGYYSSEEETPTDEDTRAASA
jgi:capsular exopolysaccharide synthesis family protein